MKRFLLSISIGLAAAVSPAFGLSGGPFSNDSPLSTGGSGTYQGIASGDNLLGIAAFGYSETTGSTGLYVFFHDGVQVTGDVQVVVDFPGRRIVGIMGGSSGNGAFEAHIDTTKPIVMATGSGEFVHGGPLSTVTTSFTSTTNDPEGNQINETVATVDSETVTVTTSTNDQNETVVSTSNTDTTTISSNTSDAAGNELNKTEIEIVNSDSSPQVSATFDIDLTRTSISIGGGASGSGGGDSGSGGGDSGSGGGDSGSGSGDSGSSGSSGSGTSA
jgi:hypothetical protein